MKREFRTAFNKLRKIGVPVYAEVEGGFIISAEENYETTWADYYRENDVALDDFGVNHKINDILHDHGLFAEWENGGVLGVSKK
tara:strand:+ start:423 stop:674 length:252 start_codon:yes stop_codon:yes gene_type:complete